MGGIYNQQVDALAFAFVSVDADGKLGTLPVDADGNRLYLLSQAPTSNPCSIARLKSSKPQL
jgi:hypothetical protein